MRVHERLAHVLLGSVVTLVTLATGVGAALGGWIAGRRAETPVGGAVAGGVAGLVGGLPWAGLVYLASAGAIEPVGYHEGGVHVGVNTAAPGTFALWQEVGFAALLLSVVVAVAVGGGLLGGARTDVLDEMRRELSSAV